MSNRPIDIAIIGAGMGGLTSAATLRRIGAKVTIYEQTKKFVRIGSGIQHSPNAIKVIRELGLEPRLRAKAFMPTLTRFKDSHGKLLWERMQGENFEKRYGAPHLQLHRAELHEALASLVPPDIIQLNRKLTALKDGGDSVLLTFADGTTARHDAVIAADGVHSFVREWMHGAKKPTYTGRIAYRTTFPAALLGNHKIEESTKWMAEDRHIVIYYINAQRSEVYFVTSTPEPNFDDESWTLQGDVNEMREAYKDFHPEVRGVLAACPQVNKWAIVQRDPLPYWTRGRIALLGDACHPMTPYMAQGAATSIEDAAILSRCLDGVSSNDIAAALRKYEANRLPRTARIQTSSSLNDVNKVREEQDFVMSYEAWQVPLIDPTA